MEEKVHRMAVMSKNGEDLATWTLSDTAAVEEAQRIFDESRKKGMTPFSVTPGQRGGVQMDKFDPQVEEVVFIVPMAGG